MNPPSGIVYLVDDDPSFLRSLTRLLRATGLDVVAFASPAELLAILRPDLEGCVVTDLKMPGLDGIGLQEALRRSDCLLPVVFLTGQGDIPTTVRAMRQGAVDFLTKHAPKEELLGAIGRALAEGQRWRREREQRVASRRAFEALSARELEVLRRVLTGAPNKQIAADLGIHERTVKFHRTSITTKVGVRSVAELGRLVREADLFPGG